MILFTEYGNAEEVRKADCLPYIQAPAVPITQAMTNYTGNQPIHGNVSGGGGYRTQKMPTQHNNYNQQQQQQQQHQPQTMPYKNQQSTNKMR